MDTSLRSRRRLSPVPALLLGLTLGLPTPAAAQFDEDQTGAWAMLFWNTSFGDGPWGLQGDVQYRNWDLVGDLEQLLIRSGVTWSPEGTGLTLTGGLAHVTTGEFGDGDGTTTERRVYQEALLRQSVGDLLLIRHRYRSEQRWVDEQDFRTRYRYALFVDVPLNGRGTGDGAVYLALYDEVFINGELGIGNGEQVQRFDRNRLYGALGFGLTDAARVQAGYMLQTLATRSKGQLQLSLHAAF